MAVAVFLFSTKLDRAAEKIVPSGLILEIENIYIVRSVGLSLLVTVFLHIRTAATKQVLHVPIRMDKEIGGDRKNTFIRCMTMNSFALRHTRGGERWSGKLPVIYQANTDFGNT